MSTLTQAPSILITGAASGLGLQFTKQYAASGWRIIATCRRPEMAAELRQVSGKVLIRQLDITDEQQISGLAAELKDTPLDVLLNNAAIHGPQDARASFGGLDVAAWLEVLRVNSIAPLKVTEAFLPHIRAGTHKKIVFISSRAGSIGERGLLPHHQRGGPYVYRSSKAALNAAAKSLAFDLAPEAISVLLLHPGWVLTAMGGTEAVLDQVTSVTGMRQAIERLTLAGSGKFRNYDGSAIPW